jgi:hypothetical protein
LPRTRVPKSDRTYLGRRSSVTLRLALLIDRPLACAHRSRTDDPGSSELASFP